MDNRCFFGILAIWRLRAKMWNFPIFACKLSGTGRNLSPQIGLSKHHFQRRFIRVATVFLMRFVCLPNPETPRPGWEDPVGKDQRFGDSIAIASSIKRLCQAKRLTQHVIA